MCFLTILEYWNAMICRLIPRGILLLFLKKENIPIQNIHIHFSHIIKNDIFLFRALNTFDNF